MVEIIWEISKVILVMIGTSIYWVLRREKDAAMVSAIIFGLIGKSKHKPKFKRMAIDLYTDALYKRGFDIRRYAEKFKKRYDEK